MEELRWLAPRDADAFARLRARGYETDPMAFAGEPSSDPTLDPAIVAERLAAAEAGRESWVVGCFRPELVGVAGLVREEPAKFRHKARLWGFYVEPRARRAGVGRMLLEACAEHARSVGVERILLRVAASQAPAIALYQQLGWTTFGREPGALRGGSGDEDELHMVLDLAGAGAGEAGVGRT